VIFDWVNKFNYLGEMIGIGGGCEEASSARLRGVGCKFRELAPILMKKGASLIVKGKLYSTSVRSVLVYGSDTWAMRVEDMNRLERAERIMVRSMCGVSMREEKSSDGLLGRLAIVSVADVVRKGRLHWYMGMWRGRMWRIGYPSVRS